MAGRSRPKDGVASARLCPAIHVFLALGQDVDARHEAGHDDFAKTQLFFSPDMIGPNKSQLSPLKRIICNCSSGAKSVGLVLICVPGRYTPISKFRLAACLMMFSRVRSSPHCRSTCSSPLATP